MTSRIWQDISALRAEPSGMAGADRQRKRIFTAALRQAEELAQAAEQVSYAARPLLAFYSLSQASRAIAAARLARRPEFSTHGLGFEFPDRTDVLTGVVAPDEDRSGRGAFQAVTDSTNSPPLAGAASIGALWAANPDLRHVRMTGAEGRWPPCLDGLLGGRNGPPDAQTSTGDQVVIMLGGADGTGQQIRDSFRLYPTLTGVEPIVDPDQGYQIAGPDEKVKQQLGPDGVPRIMVRRPAESGLFPISEHWAREDSFFSYVERDERAVLKPAEYMIGYALPFVADGPAPSPLILWWALLLGLSSLARYYPAQWTKAIDRDDSKLAVPLEQVLDVAAKLVPERILAALRGAM